MTSKAALSLAERLCRPQRLGLFGHRGVGKTTLLTMLYREAVGGRLAELRLAAGDAATANYLADKVLQLEAGAVLPATLGETELRFQLYHRDSRLELVVKDYQGEHVEVGRSEPIREFLRDCDAVWLCFEPALLESRPERLHGEQEAEQVVEDYLKLDRGDCPHRPMALVLTKADLLPPRSEGVAEEVWLTELTRDAFGMTLHALKQHAPLNALFAASSLGGKGTLSPWGLERPLLWMVEALQAQDEARLDRLFDLALWNVGLLDRCVRAFARRYPGSPRRAEFEQRLRRARNRRRRAVGIGVVAAIALLLLSLWGIDRANYASASAFEEGNDDLPAVRDRWERYLGSPLATGNNKEVRDRVRELEERIRANRREQALAELHRLADDPTSATSDVRRKLKEFLDEFTETPEPDKLRAAIDRKIRPLREREARESLEQLVKSETAASAAPRKHLEDLAARADRLLTEFADTATAAELRKKRAGYLARIDEHDFEAARSFRADHAGDFKGCRQKYQDYLSQHPQGKFESEARRAIAEVESAWDRHDFRPIRDLYVKKPWEFDELTARCARYLAEHDRGRFRNKARELMAWAGKVNAPREYTVKAVKGDFPVSIGRWFTRGPKLSVEIEVNGVRHGPSNIVKNDYDPKWDYEFPRTVTWKPGDSVRIIVKDHNYGTHTILDYESSESDRLAMKLLSGKFELGDSAIWFESDFRMPEVPDVD